jgi:uncharacterized protein (DUF58 family)
VRPRSRQALIALLIAGLASTACLVLVIILAARDKGEVAAPSGPGELQPDRGARHLPAGRSAPAGTPDSPPTSGPHRTERVRADGRELSPDAALEALELGDVVIYYGGSEPPAALRRLQADVAGPFSPELAAAGQAIVLARRPGAHGVIATAWRRLLRVTDPADPRLRAFCEAWLGRGLPDSG